MYSIGLATVFLYITSLISFLLGVQYENYVKPSFVLGALFFIVASGALLLMMRIRMEKQDF